MKYVTKIKVTNVRQAQTHLWRNCCFRAKNTEPAGKMMACTNCYPLEVTIVTTFTIFVTVVNPHLSQVWP